MLLWNSTYFLVKAESQQKYSIDVYPKSEGRYEVEVSNMISGKWNSVFYKQTKNEM